MTIVCLSYSKTGFDTVLACLGGKVYQWWGGRKFLSPKWGVAIFWMRLFVYLGPTPSEENASPLKANYPRNSKWQWGFSRLRDFFWIKIVKILCWLYLYRYPQWVIHGHAQTQRRGIFGSRKLLRSWNARYILALQRRKPGRTAPENFSACAKIPGLRHRTPGLAAAKLPNARAFGKDGSTALQYF